VRWLQRISGIVWLFSWYTIYREIFVWHHMTKSLRFNPPPALPGTHTPPKPGLPLLAVRLGSVAAPLVFVMATMLERARYRSNKAASNDRSAADPHAVRLRPGCSRAGPIFIHRRVQGECPLLR
jgi:hypothetical protein